MPEPRAESTDALLAQAGWVRGLALSLVGRAADADDAAQAAWLAALEKPPALRSSPRAWLRSVLRNVVARSARRSDLRTQAETRHEQRPDPEGAGEVLQRAETHRKLVDHVMALPEPGRSTILMHYFDGLSLAEIARRLGVPTGTVRSRHHRAVEDLRARLGNERADWRALLLPIAAGPAALPAATAAGKTAAEIIAMTLKAKVGIAAAAVLVLAIATLVITGRSLFEPAASGARGESVSGEAPSEAAPAMARPSAESRAITPRTFAEAERLVLHGRVRGGDGAPIEAARVVVARYDLPEPVDGDAADDPAGIARAASTNERGEFELDLRLAVPAFVVVAAAKGFAPRDSIVWAERLSGPIEIVLDKEAVVQGTVQSLDRTPVPNAKVELRWLAGGVRMRNVARSDAEGRYRVEGLPRRLDWRQYVLEASAEGFASQKLVSLTSPDPAGVVHQDLFMTRGATLKGSVVDFDTGAPLADARVLVWTMTDVHNVRKPDGTWIEHPEHLKTLAELVVGPDGTFVVDHVPSWGVHAIGAAWVDERVRPLGGVAAIAPGHAPRVANLDVPTEGSTIEITLRCKPAARVRGRVTDPDGHPIAGARVGRSPDPDENEEGWLPRGMIDAAPRQEATTDADGRYVLVGVPASVRGEAFVRLRAWETSWPRMKEASVRLAITKSGDVEAPNLVLAADFERSGVVHVRTEDGQPVWGAAILDSANSDSAIARTDRDGNAFVRFFEEIEPTRELAVRAAGFAHQPFQLVPQSSAASEATVTLRPGHSVSGTVVHPDGSPAVGASVLVDGASSRITRGFPFLSTKALADGAFELVDLPPGPYALTAHESLGDASTSATLKDVPEGPGVRVVIARPELGLGSGLVVTCIEKATGRPAIKCMVHLEKDEARLSGLASAPGEFVFENVPAGEWRLRVDPEGCTPDERTVTLAAGVVARVAVAVERGVTLKGRLRHPDGKAFVNPRASLAGSRQIPVVNPDGSFTVTGLIAGSIIGFTVWDRIGPDSFVTYVTRRRDFVAIPSDRSEATAEVPLVGGGGLTILIRGEKLFPAKGSRTEAQRDLAGRSRLEIRDSEGELVSQRTGVGDNWGDSFPPGRYTVRLEVPGLPVQDKTVEVTSGFAEVAFTVE